MFEKGILSLLKNDHKKVRDLLEDLTSTEDKGEQERLLREVAIEIKVHAKIEEEIFYPAMDRAAAEKDDRVMVQRSFEEHEVAEKALLDLLDERPGTESFKGKAQVLRGLVVAHAEEEQKMMFPKAKKHLDKEHLETLEAQARERKTLLRRSLGSEVLAGAR